MNGRRASALCWGLTMLMAAAAAVFLVLGPGRPLPSDLFGGVAGAAFLVLALAYGSVGAVIAFRLPGHRIGWLFALIGFVSALNGLTYSYAEYGLYEADLPLARDRGADLVLARADRAATRCSRSCCCPTAGCRRGAGGRSRRCCWWPSSCCRSSRLLVPGPLEDPFGVVSNPLGIQGAREAMPALDFSAWMLTWLALDSGRDRCPLAAAAGRGGWSASSSNGCSPSRRRWASWSCSTWGPGSSGPRAHLQERMAVLGVAFAAIPVGGRRRDPALPPLRHRLVINRTLVYGALTVLLAATYVGVTLLLGTALGRGSASATAVATLAVAIAFRPLRGAAPGSGRPSLQPRALRRAAAGRSVPRGPARRPRAARGRAGGAPRGPRRPAARASLPASRERASTSTRAACPSPTDPAIGAGGRSIERAGTPIARWSSTTPRRQERPDLLAGVIEAAGLAIEIARLRVEVRRQLAEVEASRARIVAAGDEERRRLERDLHDGAQQRLVSIGLALRHAQQSSAPAARRGADARRRRRRDRASRSRSCASSRAACAPPRLDAGLAPALRELARRSPLPVDVDAHRASASTTASRPPPTSSPARRSPTRPSTPRRRSVALSAARRNGSLVVRVADDGVGGAAPPAGSGLPGLTDRVAALGGSCQIDSAPRRGHADHRGAAVRVVIAEDQALLREGLARLFADGGHEVVAAVGDADRLRARGRGAPSRPRRRRRPHAADLHRRGHPRGALDHARRIPTSACSSSRSTSRRPAPSSSSRRAASATCSRTGCSTSPTSSTPRERVARGGSALDPKVVGVAGRAGGGDGLAELCEREREVLSLMAEGLTNTGDRQAARA